MEIVKKDGDMIAYAQQLADSNLLPPAFRKRPQDVLWAIEYGKALGLSPVVAMTQVHVMDGKPVASATMIGGLVRRAGHRLRVEQDDTGATATIYRADDPEFAFRATFTLADAKRAGIDRNPTWSKYPAAMCAARAVTACARMACPEALMGIEYTGEELGFAPESADLPAEAARWTDSERRSFCAALTSYGLDYDDVAEWCESLGQPRPSVLAAQRRSRLLTGLAAGDLRERFLAWQAARTVQPEPEHTEPFMPQEVEP